MRLLRASKGIQPRQLQRDLVKLMMGLIPETMIRSWDSLVRKGFYVSVEKIHKHGL
jgi:hypothetical protein